MTCPICGGKLYGRTEKAGKIIKCKTCVLKAIFTMANIAYLHNLRAIRIKAQRAN